MQYYKTYLEQTKKIFCNLFGLYCFTSLSLIYQKQNNMQNFKVINEINKSVKVQIEGVGTVAQIEIAQKLFNAGIINWKTRVSSSTCRLTDNLINIAINELCLYPREF